MCPMIGRKVPITKYRYDDLPVRVTDARIVDAMYRMTSSGVWSAGARKRECVTRPMAQIRRRRIYCALSSSQKPTTAADSRDLSSARYRRPRSPHILPPCVADFFLHDVCKRARLARSAYNNNNIIIYIVHKIMCFVCACAHKNCDPRNGSSSRRKKNTFRFAANETIARRLEAVSRPR